MDMVDATSCSTFLKNVVPNILGIGFLLQKKVTFYDTDKLKTK